jgi:hypothetical protein
MPALCQARSRRNESIEKVGFLKGASSAESKIESYFLLSRASTTAGATPEPLKICRQSHSFITIA